MISILKKFQLVFGIVVLVSVFVYGEGQKDWTTNRGIPKWKIGDWWIVSSDVLTSDLNNPDKPKRIGGITDSEPDVRSIFSVSLLFRVSETNDVADDLCDLIEIFPYKLPPGVTDDTAGEPLWRLSIRKDDGTLAKIEWNLRQYPCFVTGPVQQHGSRIYKQHSPIVNVIDQLTQLDVPYLSHAINERVIEYTEVQTGKKLTNTVSVIHEKVIEYTDEWTAQKRTQTVDVIEDVVFGKRQEVLIVNISCNEDRTVRTQTWVAGFPWWVQSSFLQMNGNLEYGTIRSRLVEFGNKEQKPTAKNILQGSVLPTPISHGDTKNGLP